MNEYEKGYKEGYKQGIMEGKKTCTKILLKTYETIIQELKEE